MSTITWSAKNNSSFLNGARPAKSLLAAVRAGRQYVQGELYGEGIITIYQDGQPIRQDEKSIFTGHAWQSKEI